MFAKKDLYNECSKDSVYSTNEKSYERGRKTTSQKYDVSFSFFGLDTLAIQDESVVFSDSDFWIF